MASKRPISIIPAERIEQSILFIRGQKVLLDWDLAKLYGVEIRALNQAVKRNLERFPDDFMFQLAAEEAEALRSQIVILKTGRGQHRKYLPYAFTEQGVAMLSSVLRSQQAIQVNIEIMRAFVRLRRILADNAELARRLDEVEKHLGDHEEQFVQVIRAIRELMAPPARPARRRIGFHVTDDASADEMPRNASGKAKGSRRSWNRQSTRASSRGK
jgi:hypothetical protein